MQRYFCKTTEAFLLLIIVLLVTGCAPGPPPPIPPGLFSAGIGWIVTGLLVWGAILLWKKINSNKITKTDHLTDALNAINDRLTALEKKRINQKKNKEQ